MRSLDDARQTCEKFHPGLLGQLEAEPLLDRETAGSSALATFREARGGSLLVPAAYGGHGADALEAVRVQRALGAASPSLGAAVTMHHFTAATLYSLVSTAGRMSAAQERLLHRIAPEGLLMASGWAEGRTNQNILSPAVRARRDEAGDGWILDGSKKPCSLSGSMDLLTASISLPVEGDDTLALALVPATSPGLSVHPFWNTSVLAAAESDEVRLDGVHLPDDLVLRVRADDPSFADDLADAGFVWFVMLISSVYVGAASALVERVVDGERGSATDRAAVAIGLEAAVGLLEGAARAVRDGAAGAEAVAQVLVARYACQEILGRAVDLAVELLGGMAFIRSSEVAALAATVRALAFHPPSRSSTAEPLLAWFAGGSLEMA